MIENSIMPKVSVCQFDLEAMHNGIKCVLSRIEKDQGTSRQYRFTANMLSDMFSVGVDTIRRRVETLINTGDINETQNCDSLNIRNENGNGAVKTTIYDLDVFNKLAMTFIDNPKAVEIRKAFSDVLVKHETDTPKLPMSYAEALRALATEVEAKEEAQRAYILEKEQHEADNRDFQEGLDILNSKCAQIQTRQVQTALTTASIKSRECKRLTNENETLKEKLGDSANLKAVKSLPWLKEFFRFIDKTKWNALLGVVGREIGKICESNGFRKIRIDDPNWGEVWAYDIKAVEIFKGKLIQDLNYLRKYRIYQDA